MKNMYTGIPVDNLNLLLIDAITKGQIANAKNIIDAGANLNFQNEQRMTPFMLAGALYRGVNEQSKNVVKEFMNYVLDKMEANKNTNWDIKDQNGQGLLHWGLEAKDPSILDKLKTHININIKDTNPGYSVLHWTATYPGWENIYEKLINIGADVNLQTRDGLTPYFIVCQQAMSAQTPDNKLVKAFYAERLLQKTIDSGKCNFYITPPGGHGYYSLTIEICHIMKSTTALNTLYAAFPPGVNITDHTGKSWLSWCVEYQNIDLVNWFLEHGANANIPDNTGNTPLLKAAKLKNREIIKILLEHGADPFVENYQTGEKPVDLALAGNIFTNDEMNNLISQYANLDI